jgi:CHASE2 domain-containing sensor protein
LREKSWHYWVWAAIVLVVASTGSPYVYGYLHAETARSYLFQQMLSWGPIPVAPRKSVVVLIEDDDYWLGPLAGRRPIKRDYLARMVDRLVDMNAHIIALDFDVRLQNPNTKNIPEDYRAETQRLIEAIKRAVEHGKKIVLATPIAGRDAYTIDPDIYQASGLCTRQDSAALLSNRPVDAVTCGYIALPYDPLAIPSRLQMADGGFLDSFSLAIARADSPVLVDRLIDRIGTEVRYSNFISHQEFQSSGSEFSAKALLGGQVDRNGVDSKDVIVGANWSRDAAGRGPLVDLHWTPVGQIVGAELHANFAEAFLGERVFRATPEWVLDGIEIFFGVLAALAFAAIPTLPGKLLGIAVAILLLFVATWVGLQFGLFFDLFLPIIGLGLHSLIERLIGSDDDDRAGSEPGTPDASNKTAAAETHPRDLATTAAS